MGHQLAGNRPTISDRLPHPGRAVALPPGLQAAFWGWLTSAPPLTDAHGGCFSPGPGALGPPIQSPGVGTFSFCSNFQTPGPGSPAQVWGGGHLVLREAACHPRRVTHTVPVVATPQGQSSQRAQG